MIHNMDAFIDLGHLGHEKIRMSIQFSAKRNRQSLFTAVNISYCTEIQYMKVKGNHQLDGFTNHEIIFQLATCRFLVATNKGLFIMSTARVTCELTCLDKQGSIQRGNTLFESIHSFMAFIDT